MKAPLAAAAAAVAVLLIAAPPCRADEYEPSYAPKGPRYIKWHEGEEIPLGYHKTQRMRGSLVLGGILMFGTPWVASAITAPIVGNPYLAIPVVGPFVLAGNLPRACGDAFGGCPPDPTDRPVAFWLAFDGFQQAAGLAMLMAGMFAKTTVLVRDDVKVSRGWWMPAPIPLGPRGAGLAFVGAM